MAQRRPSTQKLHMPKMIAAKARGEELSTADITRFINGLLLGDVSPEQTGAFLMAIFLKGLTTAETVQLTYDMMHSGELLSWTEYGRLVVDKHSTGGVGDKVSLILAPALAALGCKVPMISGRGLSHTGGTLDKLESIPGFKVEQDVEHMKHILEKVGCFIVGQTADLVPADRILYSFRDVTSTVASIPLIVSSIISKKAAEGLSALVLDVKVGKAAFMNTRSSAFELAKTMVDVGSGLGLKTSAILTEMDAPIGMMIGNALEVAESIQCLKGQGPEDLEELVIKQGAELLISAGLAESALEAEGKMRTSLQDGSALLKFMEMAEAQGVAPEITKQLAKDPWSVLPKADEITEVKAETSGYISEINALALAEVALELGAGRKRKDDVLDLSAGVELLVARGSRVEIGQTWAKLHHDGRLHDDDLLSLSRAIKITDEAPQVASRILDVIHSNI